METAPRSARLETAHRWPRLWLVFYYGVLAGWILSIWRPATPPDGTLVVKFTLTQLVLLGIGVMPAAALDLYEKIGAYRAICKKQPLE